MKLSSSAQRRVPASRPYLPLRSRAGDRPSFRIHAAKTPSDAEERPVKQAEFSDSKNGASSNPNALVPRPNSDDIPLVPTSELKRSSEAPSDPNQPAWRRLVVALQSGLSTVVAWVQDLLTRLGLPLQSSQTVRLLSLLSGTTVLALMALSAHKYNTAGSANKVTPKEVLYSSFLNLVQAGHVTQARFDESNRIYFMVKPDVLQSIYPNKKIAGATPAPAPEAGAVTAADRSAASSAASTSSPAPLPSSASFSMNQPRATVAKFERHFYSLKVPQDENLLPLLRRHNVEFGAVATSWTASVSKVLTTILILWLPLMPLLFILKRQIDGRSGSSKKPTGANSRRQETITFNDVAGVGGAKEELLEVVSCLRDATKYKKLNAKMPSGVLLSGPPGTGKTLLAKAVAGEAGVPFFAVSASEFVELYVGRGAARVRELFAEARKKAPCVVFIDELDAVGSRRGLGMNEERDQTLNQLLTELDGFEGRGGILFMAATNRPNILDPALLRPGRLTRRVEVPLPDQEGRKAILSIHLSRVPLEPPLSVEEAATEMARITGGFSGAELANVVNESALMAARRNVEAIEIQDLADGVFRTRYGANSKQVNTGTQLRRQLSDFFGGFGGNKGAKINGAAGGGS